MTMGSEEPGGPHASFLDVLPPHLVSAIFVQALRLHQADLAAADAQYERHLKKRDPRRVLPLVSQAFLQASLEAEALWHHVQLNLLTLTVEGVPRLVRWLAAHAAAIRCLVLHGRALASVAAALSHAADELAAAVAAAGRLQRLELSRTLAPVVLARLRPDRLPHLRALGADLASGAGSSSSSSSNSSGSSGRWGQHGGGGDDAGSVGGGDNADSVGGGGRGLSEVEQATINLLSLPALSDLMVQSHLEAGLLPRHPSLPQLRRLHFADVRDVARAPLLPSLASTLSSLTSLRFYQRDGLVLPGPLTALPHLAHLHVAVRYRDDPVVVGADISVLSSLRALWLQHAVMAGPAAAAALAALHTLHTLGLVGGGAAAADSGVLAALGGGGGGGTWVRAAPALRALHLEVHASAVDEVVPDSWRQLAAISGLTRLELPYNRLQELPGGDYLSTLRVLDLSHNSLPGVPPALAAPGACPHLSALSLGQQEAAAVGEGAADVDALGALPALRLLVVSAGHYSHGHLAVGLRSAAEAAHLQRLRAVLPPGVRVTNQQAEFERAAGRLQALFDVRLRGGDSCSGGAGSSSAGSSSAGSSRAS